MTVPVPDFHVIIIGAGAFPHPVPILILNALLGATGLLLAQGLKQAGIAYTIYEQHDEETYARRAGQWTMALHSALPYLESILPSDLRAKLNSTTTNPWSEPDPAIAAAIPFVNGATGELMAKIPMPSPKRVIRGKLRDLLRTGVEVRFGRRLTDIRVDDDGVVAVFDREVVRGSVLVGADGVANVVDPVRPETWVFHYCLSIWTAEDPPENAEARRALFKHHMSQYCEPYRSAGEWLSQATPIRAEKGLNTALEDVKRFLDAIVKVVYDGADLQTEMDAYDESAYTRGKQDINLSVEQMYAYHHWEEIMTSPLMKGGYGALINSSATK
ncbi:FAD-dependent oxidoreductase [Aspergillus fischeri NRRL 181]|uniref:FAD-binding domain-containing protein n=1 Tax=Neosartorya fischeri (strain ATCC 1020 / DSM 3700 / CBS 544.65 / FGSC A1164 / JCM 1740 / NRRL 181 / WB 181) TaxID=331117 RepID=A1CVB3_NEOFI|nr:uncharacterized protein NFIA_045090 [Aspergillus fischeri NRRL 181]EAW25690.1 hypothetical protein NFIA_045090 [Aspergillus fischeri NRRL 181]